MIIRPKHISVRNPQAPVLDRDSEARFAACEGATTLGDHPFSLVTCVRVSCASMQASSRWDPTRGDLCSRLHARATDFSLHERGYWYRFFNFDLPEGSQGNTEADWGHWGQTRFGHARSERRRPQFTAHNSVRSLKNGLSLGGSSATRPQRSAACEWFPAV